MRSDLKKICSILLTLCLFMGVIPFNALSALTESAVPESAAKAEWSATDEEALSDGWQLHDSGGGQEQTPPEDTSKLKVDLLFWDGLKPITRIYNRCGNFSWETSGSEKPSSSYEKLHMTYSVQNQGGDSGKDGATAEQVQLTIELPAGFSYAPDSFDTKRTFSIPYIRYGYASLDQGVTIYPICTNKEDEKEDSYLDFKITTSSSIHKSESRTLPRLWCSYQAYSIVTIRDSFTNVLKGNTRSYPFQNSMFPNFEKMSSQYDDKILHLSAALSAASYTRNGMESTFKSFGFSNAKYCNYNPFNDQKTKDRDTVACAFATKKIQIGQSVYTLVTMVIRGTLEAEWYSNFDIGDTNKGEHQGFNNAKTYVKGQFESYIKDKNLVTDNVKLLITGHSRAAATADLLAMDYAKSNPCANSANTYTYTFATPCSLRNAPTENYGSIFNIINKQDVIAHVPGLFYRPGNNRVIDYEGQFDDQLGQQFNKKLKSMFGQQGSIRAVKPAPWHKDDYKWLYALDYVNMDNVDKNVSAIKPSLGKQLSDVALMKVWNFPSIFSLLNLEFVLGAHKKEVDISAGLHIGDCLTFYHSMETYICWLDVYPNLNKNYKTETKQPANPANPKRPADSNIDEFRSIIQDIIYHYVGDPMEIPISKIVDITVESKNSYSAIPDVDICDVGIYNSRGERISNTAANSKGIFLVTKWSALPANSGNKVYLKFHYKIWILDDEPYTIRILGNQEGVMSYTVTKYNASGAKTADYPFKSISVEEGKTITGRISGASASVQGATLLGMTDYDITLPDGTVIEPLEELTGDELDNITITVTEDGGGYAVGGGAYTKGEIVSLYALADTGEFLGWYEDDILISDSEELYFTCDGNRTIEARFTGQNAERPYYTTVADAAEALRDGIKNCLSPIAIEYRSESDNPSVVGEIWEKAVAHTGVSDEGDYLNYQRASFGMEYAPSYENGVYIYEISYDLAYYTNGAQESEMDLVTDDLVSSLITDEMSDYEKIQAVYRYVCENVFYDYRAEDSEIKQYTAYAALMDKTAVCQGYANLFYRMALSAGIDCRIVSGIAASSEEAHAWNIVKLDGVYYNVDATWDSSVVASDDDFQFFLRGSYNFDKLHIRGEAYKTQDFLEKYPVSETDYIEVPIEANEPIDCEDFFVQLSDGSVLTLADYESHKFMLIYGDSECGNMMAFVSFLEENYQQLEQADLPVIVSMDDTMEDILAYAANYPHLIFGQRMNCDFGCSNMLEILEPNFEGWYIMPAVFLINGNRECVYHSTGYVTESKDLIQKLDQLTSIQSDGRSYSIGEHHECVDFTYTLIDGATISKQDYIGTRTIFAYGEAGNGRSYLSAFLDILKCYTPLLAEKGIQVVTVLLDAQTNPGGWQAFCSQYPDFLCVEADNYAWSMWEALQLYDPAAETVSFPVVFMLHPDGEYVYLSSGLPKNIYDVLDWFSIVSDLEAQSVATIINALKRDGNIVVAEVICSDINASVFCGAYNNSGKMIAARSAQITSESNYQFQFDGQQFDYAKAFIVDGNFRPLCESKKS